jgi:hypothetical protein
MKHITILIISLLVSVFAQAQTKFPYDSANHQIIYTQSFRLNPKVKSDDVYASALTWFSDPAKFTNQNADPPSDPEKDKKNKRKIETEKQFENSRPLQIQDPAGSKVQAMGLKYDIGVKVDAAAATVTISNIRYYHYNASSYKQVPLYNFSGGKPCEEVGTLDYLIDCENFHEEFKNLATYCNKQIYCHISDFKSILKQKKYLNEGSPAAKAPAKTTTKAAPPKKK